MLFEKNQFRSFTFAKTTFIAYLYELTFIENLFSSSEIADLNLFISLTYDGFFWIQDSIFKNNLIEAITNPAYLFNVGYSGSLWMNSTIFDNMTIEDNVKEVAYIYSNFYQGYTEI